MTTPRDQDAHLGSTIFQLLTLRRVRASSLPGSPRAIARIWIGAALVMGLIGLIDSAPAYYAGYQFALSAAMTFAALAATAMLRDRGDPLPLAYGFIAIGLAASSVQVFVRYIPITQRYLDPWIEIAIIAWAVAAAIRLVQSIGVWAKLGARIAAKLTIAVVFLVAFKWDAVESATTDAMLSDDASPAYQHIDPEALWTSQPGLLARAIRPIEQGGRGSNAYIVSIAAGGSQQLFGREADAVLVELKDKFGSGSPAILLSNARKDLLAHPLANQTNLLGAITAIKERYDPARDVAIFYLTSHGSRNASLSTGLPDYTELAPISADFLAKKLNAAGITRRIVIVSACFSGTWIKTLASPDTIVLTASASDRTSFGCDDSRKYTAFGQAVVDSSLDRGASLRDAFSQIKRDVASAEQASGSTPSLPQAYIGSHMVNLWDAPGPYSAAMAGRASSLGPQKFADHDTASIMRNAR